MTQNDDKIIAFLTNLGLDNDQVKIYLTLQKSGTLTKLKLSQLSGITRTQVYRLVDTMRHAGLVEEIIDENRKLVQAVSPENLENLVRKQESKAEELRDSFSSIKHLITSQASQVQPGTKVLFYRGQRGIQQLAWNALRAKGELIGYTYRSWEEGLGEKVVKNWYVEAYETGFKMRDIYSDSLLESKASKYKVYDSLPEKLKDFSRSRYIPKEVFNIDHQLDIYNDVVAFYNWHEGEIFGVEIYNEKVAKMQRQLFELVWSQAKYKGLS